jgi:predicted transcriptional regulator
MTGMPRTARDVLRRVETWPKEDQEELVELAREIEARRSGVYLLDEEEEAAIREGFAELDRGEWVDEEEMKVFWERCGII